ncbi:hypothetical protein HGRIS_009676, partial [Hohenbuehelia grisea]
VLAFLPTCAEAYVFVSIRTTEILHAAFLMCCESRRDLSKPRGTASIPESIDFDLLVCYDLMVIC